MACEICGRGSCTRSFHSVDAQEELDSVADNVKDRCRRIIRSAVESVDGEHNSNEEYMVNMEDVLRAIDDADL